MSLSDSKVHKCWRMMRYRCNSPSSPLFKRYGARGIKVCKRWNKFENFLEDMGLPPSHKHSIDRINGAKGYSPNNCRWATPREQSTNLKTNVLITFKGQTFNQREWSRKLGLNRSTLRNRIKAGWSSHQALSTPPGKYTQKES